MDTKQVSEALQDIHNSFYYINAGGCGEFAKMVGENLKQNKLKFKYVLISDTYISTLESMRNFRDLGDGINDMFVRMENGFTICHIMVYHKGKFIDSTGVHNSLNDTMWCKDRGYNISAVLSEDILNTWCNQNTWNTTFKRDQIPAIRERVNQLDFNRLAIN